MGRSHLRSPHQHLGSQELRVSGIMGENGSSESVFEWEKRENVSYYIISSGKSLIVVDNDSRGRRRWFVKNVFHQLTRGSCCQEN